ncbi:MAG: NAD(P)/FAD-dependent oxidoreductase [Candidatus Omnitrophica bacterium]|nr:NAD(P)/FAD-dependent oxidoreductase [Candidatus Omnitrophota bacterium]MCM8827196.1 NAD(P)/FAD-dependent oxidoreductase [Candidatus Omnitrophota bacterium]
MYEVAIIGGGAAGIELAKQCGKNKLSSVVIDYSLDNLGGTCLNKGCIPTKYYLNISRYNNNLRELYENKNNIVLSIKKLAFDYLRKQGIEFIWGKARLSDSHTILVDSKKIEARYIVIATGSKPYSPIEPSREIIFAEDIFSFPQLPDKFLVIGGGAVGLEIACILNNLGRKVTIVEKENSILPNFDCSITQRLKLILEKKGINFNLAQDIKNYNLKDFDMVILACGRVPNVEDLGLDVLGIVCQNSWIKTDERLRTNIPNIYSCGDVIGEKLYAYAGLHQARVCVDNILGKHSYKDYLGLAQCVFTQPNLATVGILEEEAKSKNIKYKVVKSNFLPFSSSYVYLDTQGFIEVLFDEDEKIIGAGIISHLASELISIFSLAIRYGFTISELRKATFIHPTISEIITDIFN